VIRRQRVVDHFDVAGKALLVPTVLGVLWQLDLLFGFFQRKTFTDRIPDGGLQIFVVTNELLHAGAIGDLAVPRNEGLDIHTEHLVEHIHIALAAASRLLIDKGDRVLEKQVPKVRSLVFWEDHDRIAVGVGGTDIDQLDLVIPIVEGEILREGDVWNELDPVAPIVSVVQQQILLAKEGFPLV
jgi:hypothetical protein